MTVQYTKRVERANEKLREELVEAQQQLDRISDNPLEASLRLLIGASLTHQHKIFKNRKFQRLSEIVELRLCLPRQMGLSTSIVNAAAYYFNEVDVLQPPLQRPSTILNGICTVRCHSSVNGFIGRKVSCVIVDPWTGLFGGREGENSWQDIRDKIMSRFDASQPYLLILAG